MANKKIRINATKANSGSGVFVGYIFIILGFVFGLLTMNPLALLIFCSIGFYYAFASYGFEVKKSRTEFREYFQEKKFVGFEHTGVTSDDAIDMVFNKKRADDRKTWLETVYDRNSFADTSKQMIPYEEFINKELIHFSK